MATRTIKDPRVSAHPSKEMEARDFSDGPPGPEHPPAGHEQFTGDHITKEQASDFIDRAIDRWSIGDPAAVREQWTDAERQAEADRRDMTPGTAHPDPDKAAKGWVAGPHGTYIRQQPDADRQNEADHGDFEAGE